MEQGGLQSGRKLLVTVDIVEFRIKAMHSSAHPPLTPVAASSIDQVLSRSGIQYHSIDFDCTLGGISNCWPRLEAN
jgi:hypothetical protein